MKYTLVQMVQDIMSNMSSDQVNSISDTPESLQVATIVRQKYFDIINRLELPDHDQLIQFEPSLDLTSPVIMYMPDGVTDVKWIKYFDSNINTAISATASTTRNNEINGIFPAENVNEPPLTPPGYKHVMILSNRQYIDYINAFNPSDFDVSTFLFEDTSNKFDGAYTFYYKSDRTPMYCTVISNYYVIFDSYDNTQDTTLQASKVMAMGSVIPQFLMEDTFIPDLTEEQFGLLLNESKALAFYELKQQPHALAATEVQRGWSSIQKQKSVVDKPSYFDQTPNYGRKSVYSWRPTFKWH